MHSTLLAYTFAKVTQEVAWRERIRAVREAFSATSLPASGAPDVSDIDLVFRDDEDEIDAEAFPRSRELVGLLLHADPDAEFRAGLDAILTGFAAHL